MGGRPPQKRLWLVWKYDDQHMILQPINKNLVPTGQKQTISLQEFEASYQPAPEFVIEMGQEGEPRPIWRAQDTPAPEPEAQEKPAQEKPAQEAAPDAADSGKKPFYLIDDEEEDLAGKVLLDEAVSEEEPAKEEVELDVEREIREQAHKRRMEAMARAEREARTAFGLGVSHLRRGNKDRAEKIFSDLADIKGEFAPEHKHMFNEFGISLRKNELLDLALKNYFRALQLSPGDENLHHNIARVYWEKGDMHNCSLYLRKSLDLNPDMEYSQRFLRYLEKHKKRRKGIFRDLLPHPKGQNKKRPGNRSQAGRKKR